MDDRVKNLLHNPLFDSLRLDDISSLVERCEILSFRKGDVVFSEGDTSRAAYLVLEGCLGVRKGVLDKEDDRVPLMPVIAENRPGDLVGEFSFFDARPRSCEVFAIADTEVLLIEPETYQRFSAAYPDVSQRIMENIVRLLIDRVRTTDRQLAIALEWGWKTHGFENLGEAE